MPKRPCPFRDGAPLQLKTRVGLRELSRGVLGEKYRRELFEKTKELLFRGAQAYMESVWKGKLGNAAGACTVADFPEPLKDTQDTCTKCSGNGQMLIGQDGKLLRHPQATEKTPVGVSKACSSCIRTVDIKEACTQCDRFVCQNCSKLCKCCNAVACSLCSIIDYSDTGEQVLCNACSMFEA
ncbi:SIVA1 apoptosis inducing factor [Chelydra serpentina]|uniref:SIVA1 apoptosis inducing factor n=2 Tax=Chelydra serpentina TaxID=8475 RepID=A0A8C3SG72_CHESE|nr:SIVA1 apoptosis inducing factor [Chelydra serpentina]